MVHAVVQQRRLPLLLQLRPITPLWVAGSVFLAGSLIIWPARRSIGRIDVTRVVRERSP